VSDYVVLKRLTLNSDLGWFKSIFDGHALNTKQKSITLNKVVLNAIWPSLLTREAMYNACKTAMRETKALSPEGMAKYAAEKAKARMVGTLPVHVELHGPAGKPPISMDRIIALQDKNWRLNGDFVLDPPEDPARFYPVMQEGDLALIGLDGVEWPTSTTVILLSQTGDVALWESLQGRVSRGTRSMVRVDPADLIALADSLGLAADHVVRHLVGTAPAAPGAVEGTSSHLPPTLAPTKLGVSPPALTTTPAQLAERRAKAARIGLLGEKMVDAYLDAEAAPGQAAHIWVSQKFAEHPYDFELLAPSGAVVTVLDAKATSRNWKDEFYMSAAELIYAASSPVPYLIYRVSRVAEGASGELRISEDIREFARTVVEALLSSSPTGTRLTELAVHPVECGIEWAPRITLPPPVP
jgi:Domain of unknown function (DUF3883)